MQIASIHHLAFYLWLVGEARKHIIAGDFSTWKPQAHLDAAVGHVAHVVPAEAEAVGGGVGNGNLQSRGPCRYAEQPETERSHFITS